MRRSQCSSSATRSCTVMSRPQRTGERERRQPVGGRAAEVRHRHELLPHVDVRRRARRCGTPAEGETVVASRVCATPVRPAPVAALGDELHELGSPEVEGVVADASVRPHVGRKVGREVGVLEKLRHPSDVSGKEQVVVAQVADDRRRRLLEAPRGAIAHRVARPSGGRRSGPSDPRGRAPGRAACRPRRRRRRRAARSRRPPARARSAPRTEGVSRAGGGNENRRVCQPR